MALRDEVPYRRRCRFGLMPHTVIGTAANVIDVTQAQSMLHGDEADVFGDAGPQGVKKREENLEVTVTWHIAMKRSIRKILPNDAEGEWMERRVVSNIFRTFSQRCSSG